MRNQLVRVINSVTDERGTHFSGSLVQFTKEEADRLVTLKAVVLIQTPVNITLSTKTEEIVDISNMEAVEEINDTEELDSLLSDMSDTVVDTANELDKKEAFIDELLSLDFPHITRQIADDLFSSGTATCLEQLAKCEVEKLVYIKGIGKKSAIRIKEHAEEMLLK